MQGQVELICRLDIWKEGHDCLQVTSQTCLCNRGHELVRVRRIRAVDIETIRLEQINASFNQSLDNAGPVVSGGQNQGRLTPSRSQGGVGAGAEQQFHHVSVPISRRKAQRRTSISHAAIDVSAGTSEKTFQVFGQAQLYRSNERRFSVWLTHAAENSPLA